MKCEVENGLSARHAQVNAESAIGAMQQGQQQPHREGEQGSAIVIALLIMALLSIFVVAALSRTATEAMIMGNDSAEARSYAAAQASLETMSRSFNKIFETRLNVTNQDKTKVEATLPIGFTGYTFTQKLRQMEDGKRVTIKDGAFEGLNATQDPWLLDTTATDINGVQVRLRRTFKNNRIPIFQFGIFYNDDMELSPGARFDFGGRVHANGNMYLRGGGRVNFNSRVTASGEVVIDVTRNGRANTADAAYANAGFGENVYIKDSVGVYQQLKIGNGSVLGGPDVNGTDGDVTDGSYNNAKWKSALTTERIDVTPIDDIFDGNLIARTKKLEMPLRLGRDRKDISYIELIKRGRLAGDFESIFFPNRYKNAAGTQIVDDQVVQLSRYYNKPGIRVSLADSKSRLPGCATSLGVAVTTRCGVRLDGASSDITNGVLWADADTNDSRGYQPVKMDDNYQATRLNGHRLYTGANYPGGTTTRQTWIKVELVTINQPSLTVTVQDITAEILSLGVTERAPNWGSLFEFDSNYYVGNEATQRTDNRSIIKLQRWVMIGPQVPSPSGIRYHTSIQTGYPPIPYIGSCITEEDDRTMNGVVPVKDTNSTEAKAFDRKVKVNGDTKSVVPFPIEMFDTREGLDNEFFYVATPYDTTPGVVPSNGVMSMIDIDVANLRRLMNGDFNSAFPTSGTAYVAAVGSRFTSAAIPTESASDQAVKSLMVYVSDRRGDADFDGEFDMEDVYGPNDNILQSGENVNGRCDRLDVTGNCADATKPAADFVWEAARYREDATNAARVTAPFENPQLRAAAGKSFSTVNVDVATFFDHHFYRRGVRLVNGTQLPGDVNNGFTLSSENGVYVFGNYNATGIASAGSPTPAEDYRPDATGGQVPASIVADAVTLLSNPWNFLTGWADATSFTSPFDSAGRPARETTVRTAIIMGDTMESLLGTPNQGGFGSERSNGAVNNFKRFLENWRPGGSAQRVNYCGSLINLFNSRNNNGSFKYGNGRVYNAPDRNWTFDTSFLDLDRLPPGTPFFQYLQLTGFQRVNEDVPLPE